ncbi:MAG: SGNH/GDSL hydrolase family protein [Victivallaceae bacterium]|nr:SGNH/GDSL hydrolase family protein [Victivallaceae bacterium]
MKIKPLIMAALFACVLSVDAGYLPLELASEWSIYVKPFRYPEDHDITQIVAATDKIGVADRVRMKLDGEYARKAEYAGEMDMLVNEFDSSKSGEALMELGFRYNRATVVFNGKVILDTRMADLRPVVPGRRGSHVVALPVTKGRNTLVVQTFADCVLPYKEEFPERAKALRETRFVYGEGDPAIYEATRPTRSNFSKISYHAPGTRERFIEENLVRNGIDGMTATLFSDFNSCREIAKTYLESIYSAQPILEFYDKAVDRIIADLKSTPAPENGAVAWHLYNMGYVIRTPRATFGIDIKHRRGCELVKYLDFALVTHNHGDHYTIDFFNEMSRNKKQVISSFHPASGYGRGRRTISIGDVLIETFDTDHNRTLPGFITCYRITCGSGKGAPVILHTGDSCYDRQINAGSVDVHIVHPRVGLCEPRLAKKMAPKSIWFSHIGEMGHCPPSIWRPIKFSEAYYDAEIMAKDGVKSSFRVPLWGEKIVLDNNGDSAGKDNMDISSVDSNFVRASVNGTEVLYHDTNVAPFAVEGFLWRKPGARDFYRLPSDLTKDDVNAGALGLANHAAGGAIRFRTDSPCVAVRARLENSYDMCHMPRTGTSGFDLYRGTEHVGTVQPLHGESFVEQMVMPAGVKEAGMADYTLNLPLYGGCRDVEIGIAPGAKLLAPTPHAVELPVLFYGSSITQGGCASRPGNAYATRLCRAVDAPQVNLGFSGSGKGEIAIARALAEFRFSAFVMDYDHNAPTVEHLERTHEAFFSEFRKSHPDTPVIMMSRPNVWKESASYETDCARRDVVRRTFDNAVKAGDKNVYFIDGAELFGDIDRSACTVDRCHPNDLGFHMMYLRVLPVLKQALGSSGR